MSYRVCADAYAAGRADIPRADPSYAAHLDRDGDGTACELADAPAGFTPRTAPVPKVTPKTTATAGVQGNTLPLTGPSEGYAATGGVLVALGIAGVFLARRRRRA